MSCGIYSLITSKLYVFSSWKTEIKPGHHTRETRVIVLQDGLSKPVRSSSVLSHSWKQKTKIYLDNYIGKQPNGLDAVITKTFNRILVLPCLVGNEDTEEVILLTCHPVRIYGGPVNESSWSWPHRQWG